MASQENDQQAHSPLPWRLNAGNAIVVMDGDNRPIARATCGGTTGVRLAEAEANAALVAAAPDLLMGLEWALAELRGQTRYDDGVAEQQEDNCYRLADAAVAKARVSA